MTGGRRTVYTDARMRSKFFAVGGALKVDVARYKQRVSQLAFAVRRFKIH